MAAPRLPKLPSIGELLEHPRLKHLVSRVNESTVAQRATGFLEEVRVSLVKRAGELETPTLASLADRFAHRLLGEAKQNPALINATGVVVGEPTLHPPLSDRVLDAAILAVSEFHDVASDDVEQRAQQITGAEVAVLTGNLESAVKLLLSELGANGDVGVAEDNKRSDAPLIDWQALAAESGVALRRPQDQGDLRLLLRSPEAGLSHDSSAADLDSPHRELESLAALARSRNAKLVDVCPMAGMIDPMEFGLPRVPTIVDRLSAGCDAVVVDAAGLLGGPECGVILGSAELLQGVLHCRKAGPYRAAPLTRILASATFAQYASDSRPIHQSPVWQLLSAPLENLEQRTRRLAAQLTEAESVAAAEAIETHSAWCRCGHRELSAPTWMVKLLPKPGREEPLRNALAWRSGGLAVRPVEQRPDLQGTVCLDLRSVFPRWDLSLVTAVEQA